MSARRLLIVERSPLFSRVLATALGAIDGVQIVGVARTCERALELLVSHRPDLVTLDVRIPGMDGLTLPRVLRQREPGLKVLMISDRTKRAAIETVENLQLGASDYLLKPTAAHGGAGGASLTALTLALREKLDVLLPLNGLQPAQPLSGVPRVLAPPHRVDAVVVASSTGGPQALSILLPALPASLPVPVVLVQRILPEFVAYLTVSLGRRCALEVEVARPGEPLRPRQVYVAPSGVHTAVRDHDGEARFEQHDGPPVNGCRPAADVLFESLPQVFGPRVLGVVLTGTGDDGAAGCGHIRASGGWTIVQHPEEALAHTTPKAVVEAGHADEVLRLGQIANRIEELARLGRPGVAS